MPSSDDSTLHRKSGLSAPEVRQRHIVLKALLIGLGAGLVASAFRLVETALEAGRVAWIAGLSRWEGFLVALAVGAVGGGAGVWLVKRFAPETAGSGIPQLRAVMRGESDLRRWRILPVKFAAGLAALGGGLALGREGPTIQMGGAVGQMVTRLFRVRVGEGEQRALISAGAGAGLAAAFNAPLAGMMFVLEELRGSLSPVIFVAAFLAAVVADIVSRLLAGDTPVFHLALMPLPPTLDVIPPALAVGLCAGFGGVFFNRCLLWSVRVFKRWRRRPIWLWGALIGALTGLSGWVYPGLAGSGGILAERALTGGIAASVLPILILARFGFTISGYGAGAAGGLFTPLLVIGSMGGYLVGWGAHAVLPGWAPHAEVFAVLGMGALFTAIVRAPLTGMVLMIEMTGQYGFMLPLLVSCLAAYSVAEALGDVPVYEALRRLNWEPDKTGGPAKSDG